MPRRARSDSYLVNKYVRDRSQLAMDGVLEIIKEFKEESQEDADAGLELVDASDEDEVELVQESVAPEESCNEEVGQ